MKSVVLALVLGLAFAVSGCETVKSVAKAICASDEAQKKADKAGVDLCPNFITEEPAK